MMSEPFERGSDLDMGEVGSFVECCDCGNVDRRRERSPVASLCEVCGSPRLQVFSARSIFSLGDTEPESTVFEGEVEIEEISDSEMFERLSYDVDGPPSDEERAYIRGLSEDESGDVSDSGSESSGYTRMLRDRFRAIQRWIR